MRTRKSIAAQGNVAPIVDLNGDAPGTSTSIAYQESDPVTPIAPGATVGDPDSPDFLGGSLIVRILSGAGPADQLRVIRGGFMVEEGSLYYGGDRIGSISGGSDGSTVLTILFDQPVSEEYGRTVTLDVVQALVRAIAFYNISETPVGGTRTIEYTLNDGDGGTSTPVTAQVTVTPVDDPAVAQDDSFTAYEQQPLTGNVFADNGNGEDGDPDGTPIFVTSVNGDPNAVGKQIILESGGTLTVNANGTFTYNPPFDLASSDSGAVNGTAADGFSYTITGGDGADVTINVIGQADANDVYYGDAGDNEIIGTPLRDIFRLEQGGNDRAFGLGGNDSFYFGAAFNASDLADGGEGFDVLILQGDYSGGVTFGSGSFSNIPGIESISLLSGTNTSYGGSGEGIARYNLTFIDANVAAGATLRINGFYLGASEFLTVNGAAETNGSFLIFGGLGQDHLTGGAKNDVFFFGQDERFGGNDSVNGGAGFDVVYLRGDYDIDFTGSVAAFASQTAFVAASPGALVNVESVGLLSYSDTTFAGGGDGEFDYSIVFADSMLATGQSITFNASRLMATETFYFDGSDEASGAFRLFSGAADDTLIGGGGNDLIFGGLGADALNGGGGADVFRYQAVEESSASQPDEIVAFQSGVDKVDLGRIDTDPLAAGDQAFTFIGSNAFSGAGAELRLEYNEDLGRWEAQGDVNGDGQADLLILFTDTQVVTGSDFML